MTHAPSPIGVSSWNAFAKVRNNNRMLVSFGLDRGIDQDAVQSDALNKASKNRSFTPWLANASGQNPVTRRLRSMTKIG